jgi:superfamily II DNA or RNA helicase
MGGAVVSDAVCLAHDWIPEMDYAAFLTSKKRVFAGDGIDVDRLPPQLYAWQAAIVRWALRKGRAAIFADCGLGKTFMQVAWANALNERVLILAPLCRGRADD